MDAYLSSPLFTSDETLWAHERLNVETPFDLDSPLTEQQFLSSFWETSQEEFCHESYSETSSMSSNSVSTCLTSTDLTSPSSVSSGSMSPNSMHSPDSIEQRGDEQSVYSDISLVKIESEQEMTPLTFPIAASPFNFTNFTNCQYDDLSTKTRNLVQSRIEEERVRAMVRKQKNRDVAKKSRHRKKLQIESMEAKIKLLEASLLSQTHQVNDLRAEISTQKKQIPILIKTFKIVWKENTAFKQRLEEEKSM